MPMYSAYSPPNDDASRRLSSRRAVRVSWITAQTNAVAVSGPGTASTHAASASRNAA
jgi:hypothetical protein